MPTMGTCSWGVRSRHSSISTSRSRGSVQRLTGLSPRRWFITLTTVSVCIIWPGYSHSSKLVNTRKQSVTDGDPHDIITPLVGLSLCLATTSDATTSAKPQSWCQDPHRNGLGLGSCPWTRGSATFSRLLTSLAHCARKAAGGATCGGSSLPSGVT